jgi:hypothetical protein
VWPARQSSDEKTLQKYLRESILFLNEKETCVSLDDSSALITCDISAANIRKFKADSFVLDDKLAVTVAVKRAEVSSSVANVSEPLPEAKRMKIEEESIQDTMEVSLPSEDTEPAESSTHQEPPETEDVVASNS